MVDSKRHSRRRAGRVEIEVRSVLVLLLVLLMLVDVGMLWWLGCVCVLAPGSYHPLF